MRDRVPAFDGLRAIAALAVVAHHTEVPGLAGGWVGVDVFFVLSGYLITGLLLDERDRTGRIRVGAFYLRRAARLYPALLITTIGCVAVGALGFREGGVVLAYLSDVWLMLGGWLRPLDHTWSLAVEEHFYLLWPAVVLTLRSRRSVAIGATAGLVASFAAAILAGPIELTWAEYVSPHVRGWELLVGCVLATVPDRYRWFVSAASVMTGLIGIALAYRDGWFGWWGRDLSAMVAACGFTIVTLVAGEQPGGVARLLAVRPLRWIGERSYGIYLFHVPAVVAATRVHFPLIATIPFVLLVAALSYRLIEVPVRVKARSWLRSREGRSGVDVVVLSRPGESVADARACPEGGEDRLEAVSPSL